MNNKFLVSCLFGVIYLFFGYAGDGVCQDPTNTMCPVLTDEAIDPQVFVEYQGKRVYLCCGKCRKKFLEAPASYLPNLPQFSSSFTTSPPSATKQTTPPANSAPAAKLEPLQSFGARLLYFIGKFHPLLIHFPIALILAAALAEIALVLTGKAFLGDVARFNLAFGALGAVAAALLGWAAAYFANFPGMATNLFLHRWLGSTTAILALVTCVLQQVAYGRHGHRAVVSYRLLLALTVVFLMLTGHFGGTLIYGDDQLSWPK